jgi:hypothetical protein
LGAAFRWFTAPSAFKSKAAIETPPVWPTAEDCLQEGSERMTVRAKRYGGTSMLMEMEEFASFPKGTERYIRRSLDIGLRRRDAVRRWARTDAEADSIRAQDIVYDRLDEIRGQIPDDVAIAPMASMVAALVALSAFDLAQGLLPSFAAYRFLYERLLGAAVRPWLPAAFCAAASLPHLHPDRRRALLETAADAVACAGWSGREPRFVPEWVEKVDATISA